MNLLRKLAFVLLLLPAVAWAQSFSAFVSAKKVPVDGALDVSFRLDNAEGRNFQPPSFDGFQVLGGPATSQSMQFVNGVMNQSVTFSYKIRPKSQGKKTIGSARIEVNGKTLATDPLDVEVGPAGSSSSGETAESEDADLNAEQLKQIQSNFFVRTSASKTDVYQGEQITVTYKLFTRINFNGFSPKPPSYQGFWVEELDPGSRQLARETYNGQAFNATVFKQVVLFPQKSGRVTIEPMTIETGVQVLNRGTRNSGSIFDSFFDSYKVVPYSLTTEPISLNIRPLPENGKPANFAGAVGKFNLTATLDRDSANTGDAITLHIEVSGEGNIRTLPDFKLAFPPDFDLYDPKTSEKLSRNSGLIGGVKSWDYLLIPRNPGRFRLPEVEFSYFDPATRQYVTEKSALPELVVTGEPLGQSAASGPGKEDVKLLNQDIHYLMADERLRKRGSTFAGSAAFWALYLLPLLGFAGFVWQQRRQSERLRDPKGYRMRKAREMAAARLKTANELMGGDRKAFFQEISRAIWGYLSDKLSLNLSELSRAEVRSRLLDRNAPEALVSQFESLLDRCEFALYAPPGSAMETGDALAEATALIAGFEEAFH